MSFSNVIQHKSSTKKRAMRNFLLPGVSGMIFMFFRLAFQLRLTRDDTRCGIFTRHQLAVLRWFGRIVPTMLRRLFNPYRSALVLFDEASITCCLLYTS